MAEKSKKDLAFDRERAKYRKQINELESEISSKNKELSNKDKEISDLKLTLDERELKIQEKEDHINRLLEYMDMSKEEYKNAIAKDEIKAKVSETLNNMNHISRIFGF